MAITGRAKFHRQPRGVTASTPSSGGAITAQPAAATFASTSARSRRSPCSSASTDCAIDNTVVPASPSRPAPTSAGPTDRALANSAAPAHDTAADPHSVRLRPAHRTTAADPTPDSAAPADHSAENTPMRV